MKPKLERFLCNTGITVYVLIVASALVYLYDIMTNWFRGFSVGIIIGVSVGVVITAVMYMSSGGEEFCDRGKK